MAEGKQITDPKTRKQELIAQLAESRQTISHGREVLKEQLQVKKQVRRFVSRKPKAVFAGSVAAGLILTVLLKRPRKSKKSSTRTAGTVLLGWGLSLVKPAAKAWLVTRAKKLAADRIAQLQSGHSSHSQRVFEKEA